MPHKHKRDKSKNPSSYDLPPASRALPLPVGKRPHGTTKSHPSSLKDDTPRAFTRLMTFASTGRKTPRGLDNGPAPKSAKKRKRDPSDVAPERPAHRNTADQATTTTDTSTAAATVTAPKILPSERLSDFAARVDQAIPVSGLVKNRGRGPSDRQTRTEKRMQRMQRQWREEEERRRQKREEEQQEHDEEGGWADEEFWGSSRKKRKRGKGRGGGNNTNNSIVGEDEDPWAVIAVKRQEEREEREEREGRDGKAKGGLVGLHDAVMEPLKITKVPKERLVDANIKVLGGLKRQEELKEARRQVVDGYRKMMSERKGDRFLRVGPIA